MRKFRVKPNLCTTKANGNVTQFLYDTLNRLTQVTDANGDITNYSYDANGNLTQVTDANGNNKRCPGIYQRYRLNRSANIGRTRLRGFFEKR